MSDMSFSVSESRFLPGLSTEGLQIMETSFSQLGPTDALRPGMVVADLTELDHLNELEQLACANVAKVDHLVRRDEHLDGRSSFVRRYPLGPLLWPLDRHFGFTGAALILPFDGRRVGAHPSVPPRIRPSPRQRNGLTVLSLSCIEFEDMVNTEVACEVSYCQGTSPMVPSVRYFGGKQSKIGESGSLPTLSTPAEGRPERIAALMLQRVAEFSY